MNRQIFRRIATFNLFENSEKESEVTADSLRQQLYVTRVYIILLSTALTIVVLFTCLDQKSVQYTVPVPLLEDYERLDIAYAESLSCPCKQVAISYPEMVSVKPVFHQICSSEWVSDRWIKSLYSPNEPLYTPLDFRSIAGSFFRSIETICFIITTTIENYFAGLRGWTFYSSHALSKASFDIQADGVIKDLTARLKMFVIGSVMIDFVGFVVRQGSVYSARNTNAFQISVPGSDRFQVVNNIYPNHDSVTFDSDIASEFSTCGPFSTAIYKAGIYNWTMDTRAFPQMMIPQPPPIHLITGMYVGCLVIDGVMASSLQCLYSEQCINETAKWTSNLPSNAWPKPLNRSLNIEFLIDDTVRSIIDKRLLDQLVFVKNFSSYYLACAPTECSYKILRRNTIIDIIGILLGLYGGLTLALQLIAPQVVRCFIYLQTNIFRNCKRMNPTLLLSTERTDSHNHPRAAWHVQILEYWMKIKEMIATKNLFTAEIVEQKLGIIATRIYVVVLITSAMILIIYSSAIVNSRDIIVLKPSLTMFENLHSLYSDTIVCPCTNVKLTHQSILNVSSIRSHQLCQSPFITSVWLDGFFKVRFENVSEFYELADNDFRHNGFILFNNLLLVCTIVVNEIQIFQIEFLREEFLTLTALPPNQFESRVDSLIINQQKQLAKNRIIGLTVVQKMIAATSIEHNMMFQTLNISGVPSIRRYSPAPSTYNTCACSVAYSCPDPGWSGGQFICRYGNNCTRDTVMWTVPGLVKSCSIFDTFLFSDLRCFFNQSCLDKVISLFNVDMPNRSPLSEHTQNVRAMNASLLSNYRPEDTIEFLLERSLVEEWSLNPDYEKYYNGCAPSLCTYQIHQRMDILYTVTTIIGVFGGLTVIFRLFIPIIVRLLFWIFKSRHIGQVNRPRIPYRQTRETLSIVKQQLMNMNFFREEMSHSRIPGIQTTAIMASRLYILSFILIMATLSIFNSVTLITIGEVKALPTLEDFYNLQMKYPKTLFCPCKNAIVSTNDFVSVTPVFHQICYSDFLTPRWIVALYGYGLTANGYSQVDRPLLSKYFQIIDQLCQAAQKHMDIHSFRGYDFKFTAKSLLPTDSFKQEIDALIKNFLLFALDGFEKMVQISQSFITSVQLPSAFNKDWLIHYGNRSNGYILRSTPRVFTHNGSCICITSQTCREPLRIGPPDLELPGLVVGCMPFHGVQMSTLECFYSNSCIMTIINYLEYHTNIDGSHPINFTIPVVPQNLNMSPLEASKSLRYTETTTIGQMINDLFVDQWINTSSYENYFVACRPETCRYEYTTRQTILYLITTMLGLYGGLTVGLRLVIWNGARLYRFVNNQMFNHQTAVEPFTTARPS